MMSTLIRRATPILHKLDHAVGRLHETRSMLVEPRMPVYQEVLGSIAETLAADSGVELWHTSLQLVRALLAPTAAVTAGLDNAGRTRA
jgi:hypothetical protein